MSPFVNRMTKKDAWVWPISGMCVVLGFMVSMAWVTDTNRRSRYANLNPTLRQRVGEASVNVDAFNDMSAQLETQNKQITELQNALVGGKKGTKVLNDQLQAAKAAAGLTKLEGPGLILTVRDSGLDLRRSNLPDEVRAGANVHDVDVMRIVNELVAAGAEAIAVNDHRVAGLTSIRCVGPTILVNDVKIASPIVIKAIGDPTTMAGGMNLNDGVLSEIRSMDPKMVSIEIAKTMSLPAYAGRTEFRLGTVPKEPS